MGYPFLSLMAISAFIAASTGTHWPHELEVEPVPSSTCPPMCREKIAEAKEKCGKKGNHGCIRGVLGEAAELCEQHCLQPILIKVQKEQSSASKMKQEEAEEESAPSSCKPCATKFAEAVRACRGSEDTAKCFIRVWEVIEGQCLVIKMQNAMTCDWKVKRC